MLQEQKMFNLEYWVGSKCIETVSYNIPYGVCKSIAIKFKEYDNYQLGKFVIKPN